MRRSGDVDPAAQAMGRKGGQARKAAGVDYARLGRKGGRAGRGALKPRSDAARRRDLARRLTRSADQGGTIQAPRMVELAPGRPELHTTMTLRSAARALGVETETARLLDTDWS